MRVAPPNSHLMEKPTRGSRVCPRTFNHAPRRPTVTSWRNPHEDHTSAHAPSTTLCPAQQSPHGETHTKMMLCGNALPVHHRSVTNSFWKAGACMKKPIILTVDGQKIAPLKYASGTATMTKHNTPNSPHPSTFNIGERINDAMSKDKHGQTNTNATHTTTLNTGGTGGRGATMPNLEMQTCNELRDKTKPSVERCNLLSINSLPKHGVA